MFRSHENPMARSICGELSKASIAMSEQKRKKIACIVCLLWLALLPSSTVFAQNEDGEDKAIERYKQMLERKPKAGSTFDRLYQFYLEGAGLDNMVADYQTAALANPNNPNLQLILGHIYKRLGKDNETVAAYQRAVELAPNNYYPHFALGQAYATLRQYENAIAALTQAVEYATESKSATLDDLTALYKTLGRAYFSRDRVDDAILAWAKISELEPDNIFARIELADLFREQELYAQAIEQHEVIIQLKTDDPYRVCLSRREIGKIQEEKGDHAGAIQSYDAALALTGQGNWLRKDLQRHVIEIYAVAGDWDGLIGYYQKKLADTPNDPELKSLLADAYLENEQVDEGISQYRKSVELAPTSAPLRQKLIAALRRAEKFAEAAAEYETLTVQLPDDFGIYRSLGVLYLQLEQPARARIVYERMLARDPENASTHLTLAEIYTEHEWFGEAVAAYEKAIALAPTNLDYVEYLGEFYFRQGNREKAVETWNRLVVGERSAAQKFERLAQLLHAKDFQEEAIAARRKAVELAPTEYRYREMLGKQLMEAENFDAAITQFAEAAKYAPSDFFTEQMAAQQIEVYRRQGVLGGKIAELEAQPQSFSGQKLLAKMYLKLRNTTAATAALKKALALNPDDIPVNRSLAEIYAQLRQHENAKAVYARLITLDNSNAREYHANLARLLLNVMEFDAAKAAAKQVLAHSPRNPEGHQILAEIALTMGDYLSAIESLKQAIRLRPQAIEIRVELAEAYQLADDLRQAVEQYWRCWELSDNLDNKLKFIKPLSDTYYVMGQEQELTERLQQMSKANPSDMTFVLALARLYRIEGDLSASRTQLARALERNSDNSKLLSQLVDISLKLGEIQDALTYQQQLVGVEPDAHNQRRLGKLLYDLGREQEAVQVWTKLLHAKNQPLEAMMKLAELLIQYNLRPLAFSACDLIAQQAHRPQSVYRLGVILVEMGGLERARPYFERILRMPKPQSSKNAKSISQPTPFAQDPLRRIRDISHNIGQRMNGHGGFIFLRPSQGIWLPPSFEDTQVAALAQLIRIARQRETFQALINRFETEAVANPRDLQALERLLYVYTLTYKNKKTVEVVNRLVTLSPDNPTYRDMHFQLLRWDYNPDYETVKEYLAQIPESMPQVRLQYTIQLATQFLQLGKKSATEKLLAQLKNEKPTDLTNRAMLITAFSQLGDTETAEKLLANFPVPVPPTLQAAPASPVINRSQMLHQYINIYQAFAGAYIDKGETDKGIEILWEVFKQTQPNINTSHWMGSLAYNHWQTGSYAPLYPAPNTYYDQVRFELLRQLFGYLWMKDQIDALYTKLQIAFEQGKPRERILSGLALSYCYWWEGKRDESQQLLETIRAENSEDLTLKLHTPLVMIQTGKQAEAISLLTELAERDPRNRLQYENLVFNLAVQTRNTTKIGELVTNLLDSPASADKLRQFSERLHGIGLTQYAIATAKKAADLAMGQNDLNALTMLSGHLAALGRERDAAALRKRVAHLTKQSILPGHTGPWRQPTRLSRREILQRESRLVEIATKHPSSFEAQAELGTFYANTDQPKNAIAVLAKAVALRPKDSRVRDRYAAMLWRDKQMDKAIEQYTILLNSDPNVFVGGDMVELPVNIFIEAGKFDEFVAVAKQIIALSDGWYEINFVEAAAQQCMENDAPQIAIELYEKLIEDRPSSLDSYLGLSHAYTAAGEHERAIECVRNGLKISASSSDNRHQQERLVSKLIELSRGTVPFVTLIAEFEAQLATEPDNLRLIWLIASMHIKARQLEASDMIVAKLLESEQKIIKYSSGIDPQWFTMLADAYHQVGDVHRQMKLLEALVEKIEHQMALWDVRRITSFYLYRQLGKAYIQNEMKEKARRLFRRMMPILLALSSDIDDEKQRIAEVYMGFEMWDDAKTLFTEIANNFFAVHHKWRAQEKLIEIRKECGDLPTASQPTEEIKGMSIRSRRRKAEEHTWRGDIEKAVAIYEQLITKMPEDRRSRAALAKLYSKQSRHDEAISMWQSLLGVDPQNTQYRSGLVETFRAAGLFPDALEIIQKLIAENPSTAYYSQLARVYMVDNRFDDAVEAYRKATELTPNDWRVYEGLAQLYVQTGNLDTAEKTYKTALQLTRHDHEQRAINRQLAEIYLQESDLDEALKKMEVEGVLTFEGLKELAQKYHKQGKLEAAVTAYKRAFRMNTYKWYRKEIVQQLVHIYRKQGGLEEVLKKTDQADSPDSEIRVELQKTLAKEYMEAGEIEKAIKISSQIIAGNAEDHEFRVAFANFCTRQRLYDEAIVVLKALIESVPKNTDYLYMLVNAYADSGSFSEAIALAQELCVEDPSRDRYARLARVYTRSNRIDDAIEAYKEAISVEIPDESSIYQVTHQELGELYMKKGDYDAAEKVLKVLGEDNRLLIEVYRHLGKWEEVLKQAEADGKLNIVMLEELAEKHLRQGKLEQAAAAYKKALRMAKNQDSGYRNIDDRLIQIYRQQSNWGEAIARAEAEGILTANMLRQQARAYRKEGKLEDALTAYKKAIDIASERTEKNSFINEIIGLNIQLGDLDAAIELYETLPLRFASSSPNHTQSRIEVDYPEDNTRKQLITAHKQQGKLRHLASYFQGRFKSEPENPAIIEILAEIYNHQNEYEKAAKKFQQLSKLKDSPLRTFYLAAAAFNRSGQADRAKDMLQQGAAEFSPYRNGYSPRSVDARLFGTIATICIDGGLYDTAITFAEDAIAQARKSGDEWRLKFIYPILGKAFIKAESYEEADNVYRQLRNIEKNRADAALQMLYQNNENLFEQLVAKQMAAIEANPDDTETHYTLAQTYESNGRHDEAIAVYEKLSQLQPDNVEWFKTLGNLYQQARETANRVEGSAFRLNGDGSFVELNDSAALNASHTQLTVEVWIKPTKMKYAAILYKGGKQTPNFLNRSFALWFTYNGITFSVSADGWQEIRLWSPTGAISLDRWHHIAGVLDTEAGSMKLYIDGIPVASQSFPKKPVYKSRLPLRVGWTHSDDERSNQFFFEGELADVRIWNTARTAHEIESHMNVTLTGDDPNLVGYVDTPQNRRSEKLVGDVEVVRYTRPVFAMPTVRHLTKAVEAYERAITLEPRAHQLYIVLAKNYLILNKANKADATYRRAIDAEPEWRKKLDSTIRRLWRFYAEREELEKGISTLESLKPKIAFNATLHKLLGDAYKEIGDSKKSDAAYAKWFEMRRKEIYDTWAPRYSSLAAQLLDMEFMPEKAVKFAKLARPHDNQFRVLRLLCRAYIANGQYTEALDEFKCVLSNPAILAWPGDWSSATLEAASLQLWLDIVEAGRRVKDRARYIEMIENLVNSMPDNPTIQRHANLELSKLYDEQAQLDKSREHQNKAGMITGSGLWIIGPFDNDDGRAD